MAKFKSDELIKGFKFILKKSPCDLNRIKNLDLDKVIKQRDVEAVISNVDLITHFNTEEALCNCQDKVFVKLFTLAQLCIEYLVHCKAQLEMNLTSVENEVRALKKVAGGQRCTDDKKYISFWSVGKDPDFKCSSCFKAFISDRHLLKHKIRRHNFHNNEKPKQNSSTQTFNCDNPVSNNLIGKLENLLKDIPIPKQNLQSNSSTQTLCLNNIEENNVLDKLKNLLRTYAAEKEKGRANTSTQTQGHKGLESNNLSEKHQNVFKFNNCVGNGKLKVDTYTQTFPSNQSNHKPLKRFETVQLPQRSFNKSSSVQTYDNSSQKPDAYQRLENILHHLDFKCDLYCFNNTSDFQTPLKNSTPLKFTCNQQVIKVDALVQTDPVKNQHTEVKRIPESWKEVFNSAGTQVVNEHPVQQLSNTVSNECSAVVLKSVNSFVDTDMPSLTPESFKAKSNYNESANATSLIPERTVTPIQGKNQVTHEKLPHHLHLSSESTFVQPVKMPEGDDAMCISSNETIQSSIQEVIEEADSSQSIFNESSMGSSSGISNGEDPKILKVLWQTSKFNSMSSIDLNSSPDSHKGKLQSMSFNCSEHFESSKRDKNNEKNSQSRPILTSKPFTTPLTTGQSFISSRLKNRNSISEPILGSKPRELCIHMKKKPKKRPGSVSFDEHHQSSESGKTCSKSTVSAIIKLSNGTYDINTTYDLYRSETIDTHSKSFEGFKNFEKEICAPYVGPRGECSTIMEVTSVADSVGSHQPDSPVTDFRKSPPIINEAENISGTQLSLNSKIGDGNELALSVVEEEPTPCETNCSSDTGDSFSQNDVVPVLKIKVAENVNSRLRSLGIDPSWDRLPNAVRIQKGMALSASRNEVAKDNKYYFKWWHSINNRVDEMVRGKLMNKNYPIEKG